LQQAVPTITAGTPVIHALGQWSGHCQRFAPGTRQNYQAALARLLDYCQPASIADLTSGQISAYVNSRLAGRKPQSLNKDINAIRSFFRWLNETYDIPNAAAKLRKMPVCDEESRFLTEEEYRKILSVAAGRDLALVKFLANTGLRVSEMIALTPASLQGKWLTVNGKGRKRRFVPLNTTALETVQTAIQFSKSRHCFYQVCLKLAKASGCLPFGPHSLRHYFATRCMAKGVDIYRLSKILGHSSVAVTERYCHFCPEHLSGLTDRLEEDL